MIAITAAIVASIAAGIVAERRYGSRAQELTRRALTVTLYLLLPFVSFFAIGRLELDADVGGGIVLGWLALGLTGVVAYVLGRRVLGLAPHRTGSLVNASMLANTGYLGIPLSVAVLGREHLDEAIAYDALVGVVVLYLGGFAVGAALGEGPGESARSRALAFFTRNPVLPAALAGLLVPEALTPEALVDAAAVVVIALAPLGFFAVGVTLAAEAEEGVLAVPPPLDRPVLVALGLRLLLAPALLLVLSAALIDLPEAYLLAAAMPCGINALLVAHAYGLDLRLAASAIAWSTTIVLAVGLAVTAVSPGS